MIKILSDKQEKDRECIISINGSKENKIDAVCFIMEQIECFKNGGPILQSGKSINENLAQQFKNSLPLHNEKDHEHNHKDIYDPNATHVTQSPTKPRDHGEGSDEEGLVDGEEDDREQQEREEKEKERLEKIELEKRLAIERDL